MYNLYRRIQKVFTTVPRILTVSPINASLYLYKRKIINNTVQEELIKAVQYINTVKEEW